MKATKKEVETERSPLSGSSALYNSLQKGSKRLEEEGYHNHLNNNNKGSDRTPKRTSSSCNATARIHTVKNESHPKRRASTSDAVSSLGIVPPPPSLTQKAPLRLLLLIFLRRSRLILLFPSSLLVTSLHLLLSLLPLLPPNALSVLLSRNSITSYHRQRQLERHPPMKTINE